MKNMRHLILLALTPLCLSANAQLNNNVISSDTRGYLGIVPSWYNDQVLGYGTPIDRILDNTAAQIAGFKRGDVIVAVDEHTINGACDLVTLMSHYMVGNTVTVSFMRDGKPASTTLSLSTSSRSSSFNYQIDKVVQGDQIWWQFKDDNSRVRIIDQHHVTFVKTVIDQRFEFTVDLDNVNIDEVNYFYIKDKIELVKALLKKEYNTAYHAFDERFNSKTIHWVTYINPDNSCSRQDISVINNQTAKTPGNDLTPFLSDLALFPNPSNGNFSLRFTTAEKGPASIQILDMTGKNIYEESVPDFDGTYNNHIDVAKQPDGFYLLRVRVGDKQLMQKISIVKD